MLILFIYGLPFSIVTVSITFLPFHIYQAGRGRPRLVLYVLWRAYAWPGHCQTNLSRSAEGAGPRRSSRQLTPLGQGGRTVLFEDVAAVEVTVVVEVVVD